jgi:hypothetical protein
MVTGVLADTSEDVIVKVVDVAPAGTVTVAGTVADALELESETTVPPAGAAPFSVTLFAVDDAPPVTEVGLSVRVDSDGGFTVIATLFDDPLYAATTVMLTAALTVDVVLENVTEVAAAGITTDAGIDSVGSESESVTTAPPAGAGPFRATLFVVAVRPPTGEVEASVRLASPSGTTVNVPDLVVPA